MKKKARTNNQKASLPNPYLDKLSIKKGWSFLCRCRRPCHQLLRFLRDDKESKKKTADWKKRMAKKSNPCHSRRISCIAQPSTVQIPAEWQLGVIKFHELKKRMAKNTHPCHSGRISCIAQPSTMQIPTEWQQGVIKFHELKKEWQKKATLVILEESLALPNLQLFRFVRNDKESHNIIYFLFAVISAPLNHQDSKPFTSIWV